MFLLLDHDNITLDATSLRDIVSRWVRSIANLPAGIPNIRIRAYGGWFSDLTTTEDRFKAAAFYQSACPAILPIDDRYFRITFAFADELFMSNAGAPVIPIRGTVASRASPSRFRRHPSASSCPETNCELIAVRRWAKKARACTRTACPFDFGSQFERLEQKQVDVHLAVDTMLIADALTDGGHLAIASDDADLLPAAAAAVHRLRSGVTLTLIRLRDQSTYLDSQLLASGVSILGPHTSARPR